MSNLSLIVGKEIRIALRERLVLALGGIIRLLLGLALYAGFIAYQQQRITIRNRCSFFNYRALVHYSQHFLIQFIGFPIEQIVTRFTKDILLAAKNLGVYNNTIHSATGQLGL